MDVFYSHFLSVVLTNFSTEKTEKEKIAEASLNHIENRMRHDGVMVCLFIQYILSLSLSVA